MLCPGRRGRLQTPNASFNLILLQPHREVSRPWPRGRGLRWQDSVRRLSYLLEQWGTPVCRGGISVPPALFVCTLCPWRRATSTPQQSSGQAPHGSLGPSWWLQRTHWALKLLELLPCCPCQEDIESGTSLQILGSWAFGPGCQREDGSLQATLWTNLHAVVATSSWELVVQFSTAPTAILWFCYVSVSSALRVAILQICMDTWCLEDLTKPAWTH